MGFTSLQNAHQGCGTGTKTTNQPGSMKPAGISPARSHSAPSLPAGNARSPARCLRPSHRSPPSRASLPLPLPPSCPGHTGGAALAPPDRRPPGGWHLRSPRGCLRAADCRHPTQTRRSHSQSPAIRPPPRQGPATAPAAPHAIRLPRTDARPRGKSPDHCGTEPPRDGLGDPPASPTPGRGSR